MMNATTVPGAEHYREIAGMLREAARSCQFTSARKEILHLAERFESRADHHERRSRSMTAARVVGLGCSDVKLDMQLDLTDEGATVRSTSIGKKTTKVG